MTADKLVLALVSDIHFQRYRNEVFDLDADLRNELLIDAQKMGMAEGPVHGVVVVGDVAFSGKVSQYEEAIRFLQRLCNSLGCPAENVWTVPGNHDVDRDVIAGSNVIRLVHNEIRSGGPNYVDSHIKRNLEDIQARESLFAPLANYSQFAGRFGCEINPERIYWENDLTLNDGSKLRLRGINSALISSTNDNNGDQKLVVGSFQTQILREEGVTFMVICHHPLDWLMDADAVADSLNNRASIQVFGHKHRQRFISGDKSLCIVAGAVQPPHGEGSSPYYNLLSLEVAERDDIRWLDIEVWPRIWQESARSFAPDVDQSGRISRLFNVRLDTWTGRLASQSSSDLFDRTIEHPTTFSTMRPSSDTEMGSGAEPEEGNIQEMNVMRNPERRLIYRFFGLSHANIVSIASNLKLLDESDVAQREPERYQRYYKRARDRGQLASLWRQVESIYGEGYEKSNPFDKER